MRSNSDNMAAATSCSIMRKRSAAFVFGAIALLAAGAAHAASDGDQLALQQLGDGSVLVLGADGRVTQYKLTSGNLLESAMQDARPLGNHEILIKHGNRFYITLDRKMKDGEMLSEKIARSLGN